MGVSPGTADDDGLAEPADDDEPAEPAGVDGTSMRSGLRFVSLVALVGLMGAAGCVVAARHGMPWPERRQAAVAGAPAPVPSPPDENLKARHGAGEVDVLGRFVAAAPVRFSGSAVSGLVQHTSAPVGEDRDPDVNGRWVVFSSTRHSQHANLYLRRTDGGAVIQLTNDPFDNIQPAFSPDGRRIAFATNGSGNWDIAVLDVAADGGGLRPLTAAIGGSLSDVSRPAGEGRLVHVADSEDQEVHPTWSPDGRWLAYSCLSSRSGRWEIFVVAVDAGGSRRMLVTEGLFPAWSRTGQLAFQRARGRDGDWFGIWTVAVTDESVGRPAEVVSGADWAAIAPAWSPDGTRLIFATVGRDRLAASSPGVRYADSLWMVTADGGERIRLTAEGESASAPVWGADGRVYFVSDRSGGRHIWSLRPALPSGGAALPDLTAHQLPPEAKVGGRGEPLNR